MGHENKLTNYCDNPSKHGCKCCCLANANSPAPERLGECEPMMTETIDFDMEALLTNNLKDISKENVRHVFREYMQKYGHKMNEIIESLNSLAKIVNKETMAPRPAQKKRLWELLYDSVNAQMSEDEQFKAEADKAISWFRELVQGIKKKCLSGMKECACEHCYFNSILDEVLASLDREAGGEE